MAVSTISMGLLTNLVSSSIPAPLIRWQYPLFIVGAVVFTALLGWQAFLDRPGSPRSAERRQRDRALMASRVEAIMRKDIADHLTDVAPLSLSLLARPDVLRQPGSQVPATGGGGAGRRIRHAEPATEVFRRAGQSLLVLGEGGSGKSLLLAQLCLALCEDSARSGQPPVIPVRVSFGSWHRDDSSAEAWLRRVIAERYVVPARLVQEWLDDGALVLVLDSLDELPPGLRGRAIEAVNDYLHAGLRPVAIACRTAEYLEAGVGLELTHAVEIAPLERAEVVSYLDRLDSAAARAAGRVPRGDQAWWDLVSTPLMLAIISRISVHAPDASIPAGGPAKRRRERIIDTYVQELARRQPGTRASVSPEDGLRWLGWLAAWMSSHDAREFGYDTISPAWIADITGLPVSVMGSPGIMLTLALLPALLASTVIAFLAGLVYQWQSVFTVISCGPLLAMVTYAKLREFHFRPDEPIRPVARVTWLTRQAFSGIALPVVLCGMAGTLTVELIPGLFTGDSTAMVVNKLLVAGLTFLLPGLLLGGEARSIPDEALLAPGARLRRSRATAWRGVAFVAVPISAVSGVLLALRWNDDPLSGLTWFFSYGTVCSACMWLIFGGVPVLQHRALGNVIARQGYGPPRYLEFLDWAATRMLLRTVGSAYAFPHQDIQDHLATSWAEANRRKDRRRDDRKDRPSRPAPQRSAAATA